MKPHNRMIHSRAEDKDFTFYSILSSISALLCKEGNVYVDFIQCYAAAGTNGNALMDYLETFFTENVTVTVYRDKAYLQQGKPKKNNYWDRFGKPVKERNLAH